MRQLGEFILISSQLTVLIVTLLLACTPTRLSLSLENDSSQQHRRRQLDDEISPLASAAAGRTPADYWTTTNTPDKRIIDEDEDSNEHRIQTTPKPTISSHESQPIKSNISKANNVVSPASPTCQRLTKSMRKNLHVLEKLLKKLSLIKQDEPPQILPPSMLAHFSTDSWRLTSPSGRRFTVQQMQATASRTALMTVPVPNVAHFVLPKFSTDSNSLGADLRFHELVCLLSCAWVMQPRLLFIWLPADVTPTGKNWDYLRQNLTSAGWWESRVVLAHRGDLLRREQSNVENGQDESNAVLIVKLEAVLTFGGAALTTNSLIVKPFDRLRWYYFAIGGDHRRHGLSTGVFLAARGSTLASVWHTTLKRLSVGHRQALLQPRRPELLPSVLCHCMPRLCHIEPVSFARPSWSRNEIGWIYESGRLWNWRQYNYVVRLWRGGDDGGSSYWLDKFDSTAPIVNSTLNELYPFVLLGDGAS